MRTNHSIAPNSAPCVNAPGILIALSSRNMWILIIVEVNVVLIEHSFSSESGFICEEDITKKILIFSMPHKHPLAESNSSLMVTYHLLYTLINYEVR